MLLFLGAGASKSFGIPDTRGFISEFEDKIGSEDIYQRIKGAIPNEVLDMEVLMTVLHDLSKPKEELLDSIAPHTSRFLLAQRNDIEYWINDSDLKLTCGDMLRTVKRIVRTTCLAKVRDARKDILDTYDAFFKGLKAPQVVQARDGSDLWYAQMSVFTTNYDTCVETYMTTRQVMHLKGIVERYGEHVYDPTIFIRQHANIELIKLHGSIDLFVQDQVPSRGGSDGLSGTDFLRRGLWTRVHGISRRVKCFLRDRSEPPHRASICF